jgi:hypothetical protein
VLQNQDMVMRFLFRLGAPLAAGMLFALSAAPASARLDIEINKSSQKMTVSRDGETIHVWPVSTGTISYDTPSGNFTPFRMEKDHFSREWDDAPMPHSIFFTKQGHAIHGTDHVRAIGRPASHGCVRLPRANARELFDLVKREGMANTRVVLTGTVPSTDEPVARRTPSQREAPGYYREDDGFGFSRRSAREYQRETRGTWMQRPDGGRGYYDRERYAPPPPFFSRPYGW